MLSLCCPLKPRYPTSQHDAGDSRGAGVCEELQADSQAPIYKLPLEHILKGFEAAGVRQWVQHPTNGHSQSFRNAPRPPRESP